jgi:hemerythrin
MRLMRDSGFPGLEEHRAEHAVLLGQIGQLERQVAGGKRAAVATISAFVLHWLGRHVQEHDRRLVAYLAERGGRPSGGRNQANSA